MKTTLLFLSPVLPDPEGTGPARRAWACLEALEPGHRVALLVLTHPAHGRLRADGPRPPCEHLVELVHDPFDPSFRFWNFFASRFPGAYARLRGRPADWAYQTAGSFRRALRECPREPFTVLHAFRLVMAPLALAFRRRHPRAELRLDLDDFESKTRLRIARLHEANGEGEEAARLRREALAYARAEKKYLPRFQRIYACSAADREALAGFGSGVRILPNTVKIPEKRRSAGDGGVFRFLYIGSLGYAPNRDAVFRLCRGILPSLRDRRPCELVIAGHAPDNAIARLVGGTPGAVLAGNAPSSAEVFASCHALLAPLRAGGGTRLKILEAFAAGCPVASTALGVEGLEVRDGEEFLLAESDGDFVRQALRLMEDPGLRQGLAERALQKVRGCYSPEVLARALGGGGEGT